MSSLINNEMNRISINRLLINIFIFKGRFILFCRRVIVEKIFIEPWEVDESTHEFFVPDYINELADKVLKHYDFSVKNIQVVTTKPDKGGCIWKIETSKGPKSLKLLHRRPTRSLFSLGAQEYLVDVRKAKVPPIVKTKDGVNYVEAGGKLWFVAEWIEPLKPVSKDLEGAKLLCSALGEFHRLSKGYVPPPEAETASRLHKWRSNYEKIIIKIDWFRNIAKTYNELPASSYLLDVVDEFEKQARRSLERLDQSSYFELIKKGNAYWGLVHQDYGWSNGQMGHNGMWIIDLDGVSYDLPIRDLRKLISGTMSDLYKWDANWIREMIKAYHETNPISPELYDILMIDLSLPNEFYKNIKEVVYDPELFLNEQTKRLMKTIIDTDQTKWPVLAEIQNDWKRVK
jgi:CotS family spore coat protein